MDEREVTKIQSFSCVIPAGDARRTKNPADSRCSSRVIYSPLFARVYRKCPPRWTFPLDQNFRLFLRTNFGVVCYADRVRRYNDAQRSCFSGRRKLLHPVASLKCLFVTSNKTLVLWCPRIFVLVTPLCSLRRVPHRQVARRQ